MSEAPLYGKYRGTVVNNVDPEQIGRIQVTVPDVAGFLPGSWAMPCLPVTGLNMGMFTVPTVPSTKVTRRQASGRATTEVTRHGTRGRIGGVTPAVRSASAVGGVCMVSNPP